MISRQQPVRRTLEKRNKRRGSYVIWAALMMVVLIGMTGLVVDGGLLMSAHRDAHNAADAAAMAAAFAKMRGQSDADAIAIGTTFINNYNDLPDAEATINVPPVSGPYAGAPLFAEAIVTAPMPTFFVHVLPGVGNQHSVVARAVAGLEMVAAGEGVITLNPYSYPGLKVTGDAQLKVEGDIYVNSEGGGVDENGDPVETGNNRTATSVSNNAGVYAESVNIVGGVNDPENFENIEEGGLNPLDAGSLPIADPLAYLPTPFVGNGVDAIYQGSPQASDGSLALNNTAESNNEVIVDPGTGEEIMVLNPGIYESIKITGGRVELRPGIYVLSPTTNTAFVLEITGGEVIADGIMFYNTASDYDPLSGSPDNADSLDDHDTPTFSPDLEYGNVKINAAMQFNPLDTSEYAYAPPVEDVFDGMLFYQRRALDASMQIEGDSEEGNLSGTLYAKRGDVKIAGQGTYDAQFVVGSMDITGQGDVTINYDGDNIGKALKLFLVE